MKLLPPEFSFTKALEFLGLQNNASGHNQLLQHVEHDDLKMNVIVWGSAVRTDDTEVSFEEPVFTTENIARMYSGADEAIHSFSMHMARVGKVGDSRCIDTGKLYIEVETFYIDEQEYRPLDIGFIADERNEELALHLKQAREAFKKGFESDDEVILTKPWWLKSKPFNDYGLTYKTVYLLKSCFKVDIQEVIFIREELLEFVKESFVKGFNEDDSKFNEDGSKKREKNPKKLPKETQQQKREAVFEPWITEHGGAEEVKKMTKADIWEKLQEIDKRLFSANKDDFFKKQQFVAKFRSGRPKGS